MKPSNPPKEIYLQVHGIDKRELLPGDEDDEVCEVTWADERIFDTDIRYVIDRRQLRGKRVSRPSLEKRQG